MANDGQSQGNTELPPWNRPSYPGACCNGAKPLAAAPGFSLVAEAGDPPGGQVFPSADSCTRPLQRRLPREYQALEGGARVSLSQKGASQLRTGTAVGEPSL